MGDALETIARTPAARAVYEALLAQLATIGPFAAYHPRPGIPGRAPAPQRPAAHHRDRRADRRGRITKAEQVSKNRLHDEVLVFSVEAVDGELVG